MNSSCSLSPTRAPAGGLQRLKFSGLRAVGQGLFQQFGARELVSQGGLQESQCHVASWCERATKDIYPCERKPRRASSDSAANQNCERLPSPGSELVLTA